MAYEKLLEPVKIGPRVAQNRFFVQAMETNMEDPSGNPSEETTQRYCDLAAGEAGLITLEAITVTRESRARDNQESYLIRHFPEELHRILYLDMEEMC